MVSRLLEDYGCTVFEGKVTKIIFGTQTNETKEGFGNNQLYNLCSLANILFWGLIRSRRL